jgi:tRNA(Ile)-lysidine synthase
MSKPKISIENACNNLLQVFESNHISTIYLAYSGGLDSSVLIHSFSQLLSKSSSKEMTRDAVNDGTAPQVKAIALHVNHGLQNEADSWQLHCEQTCQLLGLEFYTVKLQLDEEQQKEKGVEATARDARYKWFFEFMESNNSALLTAHHQGDQAETVLLNLVRGSGVTGLAGIREQAEHSSKTLLRPFLTVPRETIERYAQQYQLDWIEDPSNSSAEFLRNRVRHDLLPLMEDIREGASKNLARLASNMRDVEGLLEEMAVEDLAGKIDARLDPLDGSYCLPVEKVENLSEARVINIIRHWLKVLGLQSPARLTLVELACWCRDKSRNRFTHQLSDGWFYGYRGALYHVPGDEPDWLETGQWTESSKPWLMRGGRQLIMRTDAESTLGVKNLEIANLSGQDECVCNDGATRSLAKLLQDQRVPIWRRSKLWGVKCGAEVIWVAGLTNLLSADDFRLEYQS